MPRLAHSGNERGAAALDHKPRTGWVRGKWLATLINVVTIAAVLRPIVENWRAVPKDNFPLSYYPMFSFKRSKRARVNYLVGIDSRGERHLLPYTCAGSGGLNQVRKHINRAVREGRAADLCQRVASSPRLGSLGPFGDVVEVHIVSGEYRLAQYFRGKKEPVSERIHATERVRRAGA